MTCPYCHYPNNENGSRFCENCGAPLTSPEKKKGHGGLIAVITILIVAAIGGITAILLLNPGGKDQAPSSPTAVAGRTEETAAYSIIETPAEDTFSEMTEETSLPETPAEIQSSDVPETDLPLSCTVSASMPEGLPATLRVPAAAASASSTIVQSGYDNSALCVIDELDETSWQEGVDGTGIGEFLTIEYETSAPIQYFVFKLGNWRDNDYFYGNNRPKTLILSFDDGTSVTADFPSDKAAYYVELSYPVSTASVTVTIADVHRGTSWDDTCIAEITAFAGR